jgi:flagellar hook-length control protein FliK
MQMADLPIPSASPVPAAHPVAGCAKPASRAASARDACAPGATSPFQDALAQELDLADISGLAPLPGARPLPGLDTPGAAGKTESKLKSGDAPAQAAAAADAPSAPSAPALIDPALLLPTFLPAPPGAQLQPQAAAAGAAARPVPALEPRQSALARLPSTPDAEPHAPGTPAAADFAAPGKLLPAAAAEPRREGAFDLSLLARHEATPAMLAPHAGAAAAASANPPAPAPADPAAANALGVDARVGERGWDQGVGEKLVWMASKNQQVAQLHLNPPELGPLDITLTLRHDQASAQFVSGHAQVRDAIEAAMPRLREMLADSGITLGNANVSADAFRGQAQPQAQQDARGYAVPPVMPAADAGVVTGGSQVLRQSRGLVDTFA